MKERYDFTKGVRGRFHQPGAVFKLPVYLDSEVESYLARSAQARGLELDELVNQLLKRDIEIIEAAK